MKKIIVLLSLVSTAAFAGSISLDTRIDSDSASYNTANGNPGYSKFYIQTGRVDFKGNAAQDLSYRLRLRFDKDQTTVNKRDNLNDTVDYATVTHKLGDFALTFGKFDVLGQGFEGATAGPDIYFKSAAYNALSRYHTGAHADYIMGDHTFILAAVDYPSDVTISSKLAQSRNVYAFIYKGALLDKTLNVIASHHTYSSPYSNGTGIDNQTNAFSTVGAQYKMANWSAQLDYDMFSTMNASNGSKTDKLDSIVAGGSYEINEMSAVKAKLELSTAKDGVSDAKTKTTGYSVAFECKPVKDADFRYHVAYTNQEVKPDATDAKTESHIIAGIRLQSDFLK
jgi:Phosphate-selective porin O and P